MNKKYMVLVNNNAVAHDMDIETAAILVQAIFEKNYKDYSLVVGIAEMGCENGK